MSGLPSAEHCGFERSCLAPAPRTPEIRGQLERRVHRRSAQPARYPCCPEGTRAAAETCLGSWQWFEGSPADAERDVRKKSLAQAGPPEPGSSLHTSIADMLDREREATRRRPEQLRRGAQIPIGALGSNVAQIDGEVRQEFVHVPSFLVPGDQTIHGEGVPETRQRRLALTATRPNSG